jgi:hypothetical protein
MQAHDTDRVKHDDRDWSVECVQCGRRFEATRSDASFCSAACRVAYGREAEKLDKFLQWLDAMGRSAIRGAEKYRHNKRVYDAMIKLSNDVGKAIVTFETD